MTDTLADETLSKDLRSFITFALAMKPDVRFQRQPDKNGPALTLSISAEESKDIEEKLSGLEPLMEKYRPLRRFLHSATDAEESTQTCTPITSFKPGVDYHLVRISQAQFDVAKQVAGRLDRIHVLHESGYLEEAEKEYGALDEYLTDQRARLIGDFKNVRFSDAVATFGADRLAAADDDCSGLVIFIVIEIFIA
ncbi:MAG: hypothetical protein ABI568_04195 [Pseudarthrobacter sp.]